MCRGKKFQRFERVERRWKNNVHTSTATRRTCERDQHLKGGDNNTFRMIEMKKEAKIMQRGVE